MSIYAKYKLEDLREKLKEVENTFLGLRTPISRLIRDENGEVSDAKIQELVFSIPKRYFQPLLISLLNLQVCTLHK